MKVLFVFLSLCCLGQLYAIDVYIVAGQSNGWNLSKLRPDPKSDKANEHKVYYYGMKCVSEPEKSKFKVLKNLDKNYGGYGLANSLREKSNSDIVFIQFCRCGSPIHQTDSKMTWYPGDDPANGKLFDKGLYQRFQTYLEHARREFKEQHGLEWNLKGLFWHQGESESNSDTSIAAYPQNLKHLITRFRMDLGSDLKIVSAHIRELDERDRKVNRILEQRAQEDPLFTVVESNDFSFRPDKNGRQDVHFNEAGAVALGQRMAKAMN